MYKGLSLDQAPPLAVPFSFYIAGSQSQAAALGVILIVVCALCLFVVNRIVGSRVGGLFG